MLVITEQTDPRVTAVLGGEWGRFGLVAGLAYSKFGAASESYDSVRWRRRNFSLAGQTFNQVWLMDLPRYIVEQQDTERLALTLSGSLEVSPQFEILADGFYTRNEQDYMRNSPIYFFDAATGLTSIDVRDEIVEQASFSNVRFQAEDLYGQRDTDTYAVRRRGNYESGGSAVSNRRPPLTRMQPNSVLPRDAKTRRGVVGQTLARPYFSPVANFSGGGRLCLKRSGCRVTEVDLRARAP